jgi:hypothetical protein
MGVLLISLIAMEGLQSHKGFIIQLTTYADPERHRQVIHEEHINGDGINIVT